MAVKEDVFPRNQNVVKHKQSVNFIKSVGQRIILYGCATSESGAADVLESRNTHFTDEAYSIIRELLVSGPPPNGWLYERLVGISRCRFKFCPAYHDASIGFFDHMQQHVRILFLWEFGAVALGIGVS